MKITFTKKAHRTRLICEREDGSLVMADLGPQIPYHDLAHFVVEQKLGMQKGFFGYVRSGYTVEELSRKEVIQSLDPQVWQSEIVTRALGSLSTGACTTEQFSELVNTELRQFEWPVLDNLNAELIEEMLGSFRGLMETYNALEDGESMSLVYQN